VQATCQPRAAVTLPLWRHGRRDASALPVGRLAIHFPGIDLALLHVGGTRVMGILLTMDAERVLLPTITPDELIALGAILADLDRMIRDLTTARVGVISGHSGTRPDQIRGVRQEPDPSGVGRERDLPLATSATGRSTHPWRA
jgi:hypothetical protein